MHLFDPDIGLLGGYGIVGRQIPPATGAAFALAYRGGPGPDAPAVMCLLGDATTNIGAFHESLNLAALWRLPVVYVIVNNQLGMGTPVEAASAEPDLWKRGWSYRIPGQRVDGNDVLAVRDAARTALERARGEYQPGLLEAVSYRLRGHSVVDPAKYRTAEMRTAAPGRSAARVPRPAGGRRGPRRGGSGGDRGRGGQGRDRGRGLRRRQPRSGGEHAVRLRVRQPGAQHLPRAAR
jgi:TPP-dependent pyruvate/acetoin dehydrogenase alpha subunit